MTLSFCLTSLPASLADTVIGRLSLLRRGLRSPQLQYADKVFLFGRSSINFLMGFCSLLAVFSFSFSAHTFAYSWEASIAASNSRAVVEHSLPAHISCLKANGCPVMIFITTCIFSIMTLYFFHVLLNSDSNRCLSVNGVILSWQYWI